MSSTTPFLTRALCGTTNECRHLYERIRRPCSLAECEATHDHQIPSGARKGNIQMTPIAEKPNRTVLVVACNRVDADVNLLPLEGVDGVAFNLQPRKAGVLAN